MKSRGSSGSVVPAERIWCVGDTRIDNRQGKSSSLHHYVQTDLGILPKSHSVSIGGFFYEYKEDGS
jgi:hypothetical protein